MVADTVKKVTVKGKVTDESKMPLPGVTVVVKIPGVASSSIGTATNDKGGVRGVVDCTEGCGTFFLFYQDGDSGCEVHEPEGRLMW